MKNASKRVLTTLFVLVSSANVFAQTSPIETYNKAQYNLDTGDVVMAMSLFRQAAEQNYAPAQARLAWILDGANRDDEAVDWYRKAAAQDYPEGQLGLAEMYIKGEGVERDFKIAISLTIQAAEQSYRPAIRKLADAYEHGRFDLKKDHATAVEWLQRGLSIDDPWAANRLAKAHRLGELSLPVDEAKANELEIKAQTLSDQ